VRHQTTSPHLKSCATGSIAAVAGCNGCHGGGGGGGMAAPLTNPVWTYGDDDDTLFRLIALGTSKLSPANAFGKLGYRRKGSENVVGPMSDFGNVIKTDDDLWRNHRLDKVSVLRPAGGRMLTPVAKSHSANRGAGVGNATARNSALLRDANRANFYMASKSA
jgi:hypothetical protein